MTQRHKGFSLIEVAIAMVIFVIGALAILRIFPTGISLVEKSGNTQLASNLSRSVLAAMRKADATPDAIYNGDFSGAGAGNNLGSWVDFEGSVSGSAKFNNTLPKSVKSTDLTTSALDNFRAIRGEKSVVRSGNGGLYALTQFSIDPGNRVAIYSEDSIENAAVNIDGTFDWTNATLKSDNNPFTPPTSTDLVLYVTYRYKDNNKIWGVDDEPVVANGNTTTLARTSGIVAGSVEIKTRKFDAVADTSLPAFQAKARCGLIALPTTFSAGQKISLDYVTDWYWMLEDLTLASTADSIFTTVPAVTQDLRQVELSVPFVKPRGARRFNTLLMADGGAGTHYSSVYEGAGLTSVPTPSKLIFPESGNTDEENANDAANLRNALREGKLAFDVEGISQPVVRVAYLTQDNWVRQLSVSAKSYKRYISTPPANFERWRDYYVDAANPSLLRFHTSEAGKSVNVTYTYNSPTGEKTTTQLFVIGTTISQSNLLGSTGNVGLIIDPVDATSADVTSILSVKGASISARTAWLTNDKYNQSFVTSLRGDL